MSHAFQADSSRASCSYPSTSMVSEPSIAPTLSHQDDRLAALHAIGTVAHFARNTTIFGEGDDADHSYRVVSGTVRLCKLMCDGRRQIAEFLLPGDFFGFEWLKAYSLTAEALTDAVVIRYARSRLERLGEAQSDVQRQLMAVLSRDLWTAHNHIVMLGRQSAKERIVSFFLTLAERHGAKEGGLLDVPMIRQDIADYLGLTIETVSRSISELKRAGLIAVPNRSQIILCDVSALREIVEGEI